MAGLGFPVNGTWQKQSDWVRRQLERGRSSGGYIGTVKERWDDVKRHYNDDGLLGGIGSGIRNWNGAVVDTILAPYSAGLDALTSEPAKAFYRGITGKERPAASPTSAQGQAGTTGQSSQVQQSKAAGTASSQPNRPAANTGAAGTGSQQGAPTVMIGGRAVPLYDKPGGLTRLRTEDGGEIVYGHTGGDDPRNLGYAIGRGP